MVELLPSAMLHTSYRHIRVHLDRPDPTAAGQDFGASPGARKYIECVRHVMGPEFRHAKSPHLTLWAYRAGGSVRFG